MKPVLLPAALLLFSLAPLLPAQTPASSSTAAEALPKDTEASAALLEQAMISMARLKSYHIQAELMVQGKKATLEGDLGKGTLFFKGTDIQGARKQRIAAEGAFYLSADEGKTWTTGAKADQDGTIFLSQLVTGPVNPGLRIWEKGEFKASEEKSGGESLIKLEKPASGQEPATTYWLVRDTKAPGPDPAYHIRRAALTIDSEAGEFPVTVTYTAFNVPVNIKAPEPAK